MRKIERHISNQGSVITFNMYDHEVKLFVADAKYRAYKAWATGTTYGTDIPELANFIADTDYISTRHIITFAKEALYKLSDFRLQFKFPSFKADKTAKENTDILMRYDDTEAAHWCRSIELEGVGQMDLPNIYELMVLYLESDRLDELDPTVNEYKQYALGVLNPNGRFNFNDQHICWSSTNTSNICALYVDYVGCIGHQNYYKYGVHGVLPVKELCIKYRKLYVYKRNSKQARHKRRITAI